MCARLAGRSLGELTERRRRRLLLLLLLLFLFLFLFPLPPLPSSLPWLTREHVEASAQGTREGLANAKQFIKIKHKVSIKGRGSGMEEEGE